MTSPNHTDLDELTQLLDYAGVAYADKRSILALYKSQLKSSLLKAQTKHLSDVARAVGILEGLGHPDKYLEDRYVELTRASKDIEGVEKDE